MARIERQRRTPMWVEIGGRKSTSRTMGSRGGGRERGGGGGGGEGERERRRRGRRGREQRR